MTRHILIALLPPGNIGKKISEIQTTFFSLYGCGAGLALPPCIPIQFCNEVPGREDLSKESWLEQKTVETTGLRVNNDCLFLAADITRTFDRIRNRFQELHALGLFAAFPGVFITSTQKDTQFVADAVKEDNSSPTLRWRTTYLSCLAIEVKEGLRWWERVYWEELYRQKCR